MFTHALSTVIKRARLRLELSQEQLGRLCGVPRHRISSFELARRYPNPVELARLVEHLDLRPDQFSPAPPKRALRQLAAKGHADQRPWRSPADRESSIRYLAAREQFPELTRRLTATIRARPDYRQVEYLSSHFALGSSGEALLVLHLLARNGEPLLMPPNLLGWLPNPCVCPVRRTEVGQRPHFALRLGNRLFFFQVTFATPRLYTVDILVRAPEGWEIWEADGPGHCDSGQAERTLALKLPVRRLTLAMIRDGAF